MILGVGIDIVEVARVRRLHERFGERFMKRVFLPGETAYCLTYRQPAPHLAARFAAKEAVSKAFGTGIGAQLGWQDIEVGRRDSGQPYLVLSDAGQRLLTRLGGGQVHLSLSHTAEHATAVAVIESRSPALTNRGNSRAFRPLQHLPPPKCKTPITCASQTKTGYAALLRARAPTVCFDRRSLAQHAGLLTREGVGHSGVILFRRTNSRIACGPQAHLLTGLWRGVATWEWSDLLVYCPRS